MKACCAFDRRALQISSDRQWTNVSSFEICQPGIDVTARGGNGNARMPAWLLKQEPRVAAGALRYGPACCRSVAGNHGPSELVAQSETHGVQMVVEGIGAGIRRRRNTAAAIT